MGLQGPIEDPVVAKLREAVQAILMEYKTFTDEEKRKVMILLLPLVINTSLPLELILESKYLYSVCIWCCVWWSHCIPCIGMVYIDTIFRFVLHVQFEDCLKHLKICQRTKRSITWTLCNSMLGQREKKLYFLDFTSAESVDWLHASPS